MTVNDTDQPVAAAAPRQRRWLMAGAAVLALAAGALVAQWQFRERAVHDQAVDLLLAQRFADPDGREIALDAYRGQVLVVNFWATWCAPCIEEMPELSTMQGEWRARGVQFLGLAIDSASRVKAFSERLPVDYPLLVTATTGNELARQFGNQNGYLPYTVVIDRLGRVTAQKLGRIKRDDLTAWIAAAANN